MFLRQSTASQEILLGPFVDSTDGVTAETGLTIANTDIKLWKGGTTSEADKNSGGATHIASGRYHATLDATDTDTVGMLEVNVAVVGALPVRRTYYVLEEAVYDALFAASSAGYATAANVAAVETDTQDIQSRLPAALVSGRIDASVGAMAANTMTASALAIDAVTEIQSGLATAASVAEITKNAFVATELAIGTVSSQTSFTLTGGPANDLANVMAIFFDNSASDAPVVAEGSYVGSTGVLTLTAATPITVTTSDTVTLVAVATAGGLDAAGVRSAIGLASANLDTQLADLPTNSELTAAFTEIKGATWDSATDTLEGIRDSGASGGLDAAGVRAAIGLASANLDTQLADIPTVAEFNARSLPSADYFVVGDYTAPDNANILLARQILGNKHNVTDNGNGTFTIVVRNDADDATVRTLVYNPTTGARTVS